MKSNYLAATNCTNFHQFFVMFFRKLLVVDGTLRKKLVKFVQFVAT